MTITELEFNCDRYIAVHFEGQNDYWKRYSATNWVWCIGNSEEYDMGSEEQEAAFQKFVEEGKIALPENGWYKFSERTPPPAVDVLAQNDEWIDEESNQRGVRIGFISTMTGKFITAVWLDSIDNFSTSIAIPTKWKHITL